MPDDDGWICHICGDDRPDEFISVRTHRSELPRGVKIDQNVRYCNDRQACIEGAETFRFIPDP